MFKRAYNRIKGKPRSSSGFTLSETMMTVIIIILLATIGLTGMLSIRRRVMITELDETAKQIYAAAQNSLVRLTNSGMSDELSGNAMSAVSAPVDFDPNLDWTKLKAGYRYTSSGETAAQLLLPFGSVEDSVRLGGFYIIEYDVQTSALYSVFFSKSAFDYSELSSDGEFRANRHRRASEMVGYYGGSGVDRDSFPRCSAPVISVENDNVLMLTVSGSKAGYSLRLTLADSDTEITVPNTALNLNATGDYTLLLDSMESGKRFKELFSELTPGDDITVTAYFESSGSLSSYARAEVNSLFASRSEGEASISCARHLQNLDSSWSKVNTSITSGVQLAAIDWPTDKSFESILNTALTAYDGSGLEIKNLRGQNGLFATFTGGELKNIRLANPKINNTTAASAVGVLAGEARDCTVRGCRVYAYAYTPGGMVDYAAYKNFGLSAIVPAGGLIGSAVNCKVDLCFSALPYIQSFNGYTGGLIGVASGCDVTKSYASCDDMTGPALGMLICSASTSTVDNCYAVGNSRTAAAPLLFAGNAGVRNSYCAFSYLNGEVRNFATDYHAYSAYGAYLTYNAETLKTGFSSGSAWSTTIAALTRPYSGTLDGRAYPFKTVSGLPHYGSWPLSGGLEVRVYVRLDGLSGVNAGRVVLTCEGETIYDSDAANVPEVVRVKPNAEIEIRAEAKLGYAFVNTRINAANRSTATSSFNISRDTDITVTFKQTVFTLTGGEVTNNSGNQNDTYIATAGTVAVRPGGTDGVLTGSIVTVEPSSVTLEYYVADVSYTSGGETVPVYRDANGEFTFAMPAGDATVNVKYTNKGAVYTVNCYLMDTLGAYPAAGSPTFTKNYKYGWGEVIADSLLNYFINESGLSVPGCITLADKYITETYEANAPQEISTLPFVSPTDPDKDGVYAYTIDLYLARAQFDLTLKAGNSITSVTAATQSDPAELTLENCYYDAEITIDAETLNSLPFTSWSSNSLNFAGTAEQRYTLRMPAHDLELTAAGGDENFFVSMSVYKNGESWTRHGQTIRLVDINDETHYYTLSNLSSLEESYLSQGEVKKGQYYIEAGFTRYTVPDGNGGNIDYVLDLSSRAVELAIDFYTVTYYPDSEDYTGTVPSSSICLYNQEYTVKGNTGLLVAADGRQFAGWYDEHVVALRPENPYSEGAKIRVTQRVDLFANWQTGLSLQYDGNGAVSGTLPAATSNYSQGDDVFVAFPTDLERPGYDFVGWSRQPDATAPEFSDGGTESFSMPAGNVTLYAMWDIATYDVSFFDVNGVKLTGAAYEMTELEYNSTLELPDYSAQPGELFLGWAESRSGGVKYTSGADITVTDDIKLYAVTADDTCVITFTSADGDTEYGSLTVGKNVGTYLPLKVGIAAEAASGWSTLTYGAGTVYLRGSSGFTAAPVTVDSDITLYGIDGKVYNQTRQEWHSTLNAAVIADNTAAGDTIIVYGDTTETGVITLDKDLTILSVGSNTVQWSSTAYVPNGVGNKHGCFDISDCAVNFGSANGGGSLTFDANRKGRVVYLMNDAQLSMYDGVTLLHGRVGNDNTALNDEFYHFGGGVFAESGAVFNMHGGTIAFCEAVSGGGVYLVTGSRMSMGNMVLADGTPYADSRIYYYYDDATASYMVASGVTSANYGNCYICVGTPTICDNISTRTPPGIQVNNDNQYQFDGGGGLFLKDLGQDALTLYSGVITRNRAACFGGGILTDSNERDVRLRIYEVEISHNSALRGGGVFQWQGIVYNYNGNIIHNYASGDGGAIYLMTDVSDIDSSLEFYFGSIENNSCAGNGGAVYIKNKTAAKIYGGIMLNNTAGGRGGAIYCEDEGELWLAGGSVSDNSDFVTDIDIYLAGDAVISVPSGHGGLNMVKAAHAINSRAIINCENAALDRSIVTYVTTGDYKQTDADFFAYGGAGDFSVLPDGVGKRLYLGTDDGQRVVTFDHNDGSTEAATLDVGTTLNNVTSAAQFPQLSKDYYHILGWAQRPDAAAIEDNPEFINVGNPYTVSDLYGQTLYAIWGENTLTYDISPAPTSVATPEMVRGTAVTSLPTVASYVSGPDAGYYLTYQHSFQNWNTKADGTGASYDALDAYDGLKTSNANITLYAIWQTAQISSKNVTLKPNGAAGTDVSYPVSNGVEFVIPACPYTLHGHSFSCWNTQADGLGADYSVGDRLEVPADLVLYAKWSPNPYTVSFDINGGTGTTPASVTGNYYTAVELPAAPSITPPEHYSFGGWKETSTGNLVVSNSYTVLKDVTLYAHWQPLEYSVTFKYMDGATSDKVEMLPYGSSFTAGSYSTPRTGYRFEGWRLKGTDTSYAASDVITVNGAMVLEAQWVQTYAVTLNWNNPPTNSSSQYHVALGENYILPSNMSENISLPHYIFTGWNTDPDGGGTGYLPGDTVSGAVTLYAQWRADK